MGDAPLSRIAFAAYMSGKAILAIAILLPRGMTDANVRISESVANQARLRALLAPRQCLPLASWIKPRRLIELIMGAH